MSDEDRTIAEVARDENWPSMTLEWFGQARSFGIPPGLVEDAPALASFIQSQLQMLRAAQP